MTHQLRRPGNPVKYFKALLTLVAVLFAQTSYAQDVATGQATANVAASLAVTSAQDLQFDAIFQGVAKSVRNNVDAKSGIFNVVGAASAGISMTFVLPDYIALSDGSDRMTISFSPTDAVVDTNNTTPATVVGGDGWINVNPNNLPTATVIGSGGQSNVYIGGRVTPTIDQKAGAYAGAITLSVAYNGT